MSRKDDPVFNVKFVQAVERNQCLWNSTLPAYSKKEEIQKAWQDVANETKDTVRSCRERWRTIRSSFLRSLKMSRTNTGRGKRKYYLSKYLQFLIPYTKTRLKHHASSSMMALRKFSSTSHLSGLAEASHTPSQTPTPIPTPPPMTRINLMPLPIVSSDDTKDSTSSDVAAIAEEDVVVSLADSEVLQQHQQQGQQNLLYTSNVNNTSFHINNLENSSYHKNNNNNNNKINSSGTPLQTSNNNNSSHINDSIQRSNGFFNQQFQHATATLQQQLQQHQIQHHQPLCLPPIKSEPTEGSSTPPPLNYSQNSRDKQSGDNSHNNNNNNNNSSSNNNTSSSNYHATPVVGHGNSCATISSSTSVATVDLSEFADWIKTKNSMIQRHYPPTAAAAPPDADQSFLNSLHPYLQEMSGKQNRRFRQKVVALVDAVLDNVD